MNLSHAQQCGKPRVPHLMSFQVVAKVIQRRVSARIGTDAEEMAVGQSGLRGVGVSCCAVLMRPILLLTVTVNTVLALLLLRVVERAPPAVQRLQANHEGAFLQVLCVWEVCFVICVMRHPLCLIQRLSKHVPLLSD